MIKTVHDFQRLKQEDHKISMVTAYDAIWARLLAESPIDCLLVGDSVSMVSHAYPTTLSATLEMMEFHTQAVTRAAGAKFIIADMPFMTFRKGKEAAAHTVERLMRAGAHAVKLEGVRGHEDVVEHIVQSGVPVMGHLGLTPQSQFQLGGLHVQARQAEEAKRLLDDAKALERLGCFSIVLECIPADLGFQVTRELSIPTIGIGAGPHTSGQVLVLQDLLGLIPGFKPKFLRTYMNGFELIQTALRTFADDVRKGRFPSEKESY